MLIKSLKRRTGTFEDQQTKRQINYDNLIFGCEAASTTNIFGPDYKEVKVKYSDFMAVYKGTLEQLQGKDVTFFFDVDGHYIGCQIK